MNLLFSKNLYIKSAVFGVALVAFCVSPRAEDKIKDWSSFDVPAVEDYAETMRTNGNIPGMAVAIVHRREGVVFARGFGQSRGGNSITEHTPFVIGELIRPVMDASAMILVEQGKLAEDKLPSGDLQSLRRLLEESGGDSVDDVLRQTLSAPLGLSSTFVVGHNGWEEGVDAYRYLFGYPMAIMPPPPESWGVGVSTASDLGKFLLFQLRRGEAVGRDEGERGGLRKGKTRRKSKVTKKPVIPKGEGDVAKVKSQPLSSARFKQLHLAEMGWRLSDEDRLEMISYGIGHSGAMVLIPEAEMGVVVVTNLNNFKAITTTLIRDGFSELLLERKTKVLPWVELWLRVAMGLTLVFVLLSFIQNLVVWRRMGFPRDFPELIGRVVFGLLMTVGLPLVVIVLMSTLNSPVELVFLQPDVALVLYVGCPLAAMRGLLKVWVMTRRIELQDTFDRSV